MRVGWFLLVLLVVRLLVAASMPLSADEAYYWVWSRALAPGYYDHPPMVALWIWLGTHVAGQTELGVRLLGPVAAFLGSWVLLWAGEALSVGAGLRAAWVLNATLALNAGSVIMTPDTPLLFFWCGCLACAALVAARRDGRWWLGAGLCAGLAMASKYTAVLLAPVLLVWVLAVPGMRVWLRRWQIYAGAALAFAVFAPVLWWNVGHGFASFAKQGGRGGVFEPAGAPRFLLELAAGQLGLATPLVFLIMCGAVWACARRWREPASGLASAAVLVPAAVFMAHALGDRVQANWPAVLYPGAALAVGLASQRVPRWAVASGVALAGLVFVQAVAAPLALPRRLDFTLIRLGGWRALAAQAQAAAAANHAGYLLADEYGLAAELAFYQDLPVLGVEPRWVMFAMPPADRAGAGLLVRTLRRRAVAADGVAVAHLTRGRGGVQAEAYDAFLVQVAPSGVAAVVMPTRH